MYLSIVTTMYHSSQYLEEFYERIKREAQKLTQSYEIIFVNDGSPDNSLEVAISLCKIDNRVKIIDLSRNFGHHKAMMTGLAHAQGTLVFLIDCDLEEDPELLSIFHETLKQNPDSDVAYGVQGSRKGGFFERVSGTLYYRVVNIFWDQKLTENLIVARLMTRRYVVNLVLHQESEIIIAGLWLNTGFRQLPVIVSKHGKATSTYSLSKKLTILIYTITSFSSKPLIYIAYLGAGILALAALFVTYLIINYFLSGKAPEGYTSLIVSMWCIGGLIIFCLGIIAIYLSVIFNETKQRPYSIVRDVYENETIKGE